LFVATFSFVILSAAKNPRIYLAVVFAVAIAAAFAIGISAGL